MVNHSDLNHAGGVSTKQAEMDELLEKTILNIELDEPLTKRETQILKLIITGNTNRKIAQKIYRTERTVEYHRSSLMRKFGTHNSAELTRKAITLGIV